jgi:hypothetical protein
MLASRILDKMIIKKQKKKAAHFLNSISVLMYWQCLFIILLSLIASSLESILNCCEFVDDGGLIDNDLINCINGSSVRIAKDSDVVRVLMLTYATPSIIDYASYSYAINSYYAEYHGYVFRFLTPKSGHQHYKNDERWNKVKILMDAIAVSRTADDAELNFDIVCFLDADLIILNVSMDIDTLIKSRPWADIIISRDSEPKNGIMNSGNLNG